MRLRRLLKGGFSFFSQEGWKNFRWGASHMQYAILDALEGALNGKPKCARGVKRYSSGVKRFLKGVKEIRPCACSSLMITSLLWLHVVNRLDAS